MTQMQETVSPLFTFGWCNGHRKSHERFEADLSRNLYCETLEMAPEESCGIFSLDGIINKRVLFAEGTRIAARPSDPEVSCVGLDFVH